MKKIFKIFMIFTVICLCSSCFKKAQKIEKEVNKQEEVEKDTYVDDNPITIGLYNRSSNGRVLTKEYKSEWVLNKDIGVFSAFATSEATINRNSILDLWPEYWNKYENIDNYRIGYHLKLSLHSGEEIEQTILKPEDAKIIYNYLQVYLYDDIHQVKGAWYSHIENMKDDTIMTTIKLTGSSFTHELASPIELSVFTYDGEEDFNSEGKYTGKSSFTAILQKSN